jgi:hypothetical protein
LEPTAPADVDELFSRGWVRARFDQAVATAAFLVSPGDPLMTKPVFAMLLGGVLGVFDGLTALISAPQEAPNIVGIVIGSTVKGMVVGLIVGLVAGQTRSVGVGLLTGVVVGALLAYLVTIGSPYLWEIVLPGSVVGLIVGVATVKYPGQ